MPLERFLDTLQVGKELGHSTTTFGVDRDRYAFTFGQGTDQFTTTFDVQTIDNPSTPKLSLVNRPITIHSDEGLRRHSHGFIPEVPPPSLSDFYGIGPGQIPIHVDMLNAASYTLGTDAGASVVTGLTNLGGTGAYHNMAADDVTTAPRLDNGSMLFRDGDLMRIVNDADLMNVHLFAEVKLTKPGPNEYQYMLRHTSNTNGNGIVSVNSNQNNAQFRWRITRVGSASGGLGPRWDAGNNIWVVWEMRAVSRDSQFTDLWAAFNGGNIQTTVDRTPGVSPNILVNWLGGNLKNQRIGAFVSVVTDPEHDMDNPEPAVLLAREKLIGRRA